MRSRLLRTPARRGIGQLEVIVIIVVLIVIITVAVALIMKQKAGLSPDDQAQLMLESRNNLKQLALALQNHNDTYKTFPPLYFSADPKLKGKLNITKAKGNYPWTVRVLPFIEEDTMYKQISSSSNKFTKPAHEVQIQHNNQKVAPTQIDLQQLQPKHLGTRSAPGNNNYVALSATRLPLLLSIDENATVDAWKDGGPDGMIIPDKQARGQSMARMADGTSRTAVLCESCELVKSNWYEPAQSFVCGLLPADETSTALGYGPTETEPQRAYNAKSGDPLDRTWGPAGGHQLIKMTMHAMGDGSVLMLSNDIDPRIYAALITTRGGEAVDRPEEAIFAQPPKK